MTEERDHSYIKRYIKNYYHQGRGFKDYLIFLGLFLLCIFLLLYLFTWVHELSHFITAIIYRIPITDLRVNWPTNGYVIYDIDTTNINKVLGLSIVTIAGSMGGFLVALTLNRIIYYNRSRRFSVFTPLFGFTGYWMVIHELIYWIKGIDYWIRGIDGPYDAIVLLDFNPSINPSFLQLFLIIICCIVSFWLTINWIVVIKTKIEIIKEKAVEWNRNNDLP